MNKLSNCDTKLQIHFILLIFINSSINKSVQKLKIDSIYFLPFVSCREIYLLHLNDFVLFRVKI